MIEFTALRKRALYYRQKCGFPYLGKPPVKQIAKA